MQVKHGNLSTFTNVSPNTVFGIVAEVPVHANMLEAAFHQACYNIHPASDAIMEGRGPTAAVQELGKSAF